MTTLTLTAPGGKPVKVSGVTNITRRERFDPTNPNELTVTYEYELGDIHDVEARVGGEVSDDYQAPAAHTKIGQPASSMREWDYPALVIVGVCFDYARRVTYIEAEATVDRDRVGV